MEDGFELLYPESSFGVNFMRGLAVIFCWLALLASIGLAAASFLSFPVAAFASLALLLMGLSSGTVGTVVEQGTIIGYDPAKAGYGHSPVDIVMVPMFRGALKIINLVEAFRRSILLSTGRSITWGQLGLAVVANRRVAGRLFLRAGHDFLYEAGTGHRAGEQLIRMLKRGPFAPSGSAVPASNRASAAGNSY